MKVLLQGWDIGCGYQVSLSKDQEQLDGTIARLKKREAGGPRDEPIEIEISDAHVLARIVRRTTVFVLEDDERGDRMIPYFH